jgi:hypothetical protein
VQKWQQISTCSNIDDNLHQYVYSPNPSRPAGVFAWLQQQGRLAALVRQISPMAGVDTMRWRWQAPASARGGLLAS